MKYSVRYMVSNFLRRLGLSRNPESCPEVQEMLKTIRSLGGKIKFEVEIDNNGDWGAEAVDLPGLIAGGSANDSFDSMIIDAIFAYFGIPPEYCDDSLLLAPRSKAKNVVYFTKFSLAGL